MKLSIAQLTWKKWTKQHKDESEYEYQNKRLHYTQKMLPQTDTDCYIVDREFIKAVRVLNELLKNHAQSCHDLIMDVKCHDVAEINLIQALDKVL